MADRSTSLISPSEKIDFGNEVDFFGDPVRVCGVGFHVFQTGENESYGGPENMPNIRFEINPSLPALPTDHLLHDGVGAGRLPGDQSLERLIDATTTGYRHHGSRSRLQPGRGSAPSRELR